MCRYRRKRRRGRHGSRVVMNGRMHSRHRRWVERALLDHWRPSCVVDVHMHVIHRPMMLGGNRCGRRPGRSRRSRGRCRGCEWRRGDGAVQESCGNGTVAFDLALPHSNDVPALFSASLAVCRPPRGTVVMVRERGQGR